jgi:translation initiation factor IF-3
VPEVRLVGEDGKQIGVIKTADALAYAQERDLDLVEVAPDARPPVCRVLDYSKYKYEQAQKQKAARRHQQQITVREIKFRPKIATNDYETKKGHVRRFLLGKDKVKITIMFRGREVTHPERGTALLDRLAGELSDIGVIEQSPVQDGRNMTMLLAPSKAVLAGERDKPTDGAASDRADRHEDEDSHQRRPEEPHDGDAVAPEDAELELHDDSDAAEAHDDAGAEQTNGVTNGVQPDGRKPDAAEAQEPDPEASTPQPAASGREGNGARERRPQSPTRGAAA